MPIISQLRALLIVFPPIVVAAPLSSRDDAHCEAATWRDVLLLNCLAHAATAPSPPGARSRIIFQSQLLCLLYPFHGLLNAVTPLFYHCVFSTNELGNALALGALAVVARTEEWNPPTKYGERLLYASLPTGFITDSEGNVECHVRVSSLFACFHADPDLQTNCCNLYPRTGKVVLRR